MTEVVLDKVVLHPLVLLSVANHFSRMGKTFEHVPFVSDSAKSLPG